MIGLFIQLLIFVVILYWIVTQLPITEPRKRIASVVILVTGLLILIRILLRVAGISVPNLL